MTTARDSSRMPHPARRGPPVDLRIAAPDDLLELSVSHPAADVCVLHVRGEVDMFTAPLLHEWLGTHLGKVAPHVVVDLEGVQFLDSSGLHALVSAAWRAKETGVLLYIAGLANSPVRMPLTAAGLLPMFRCYPTLADARSELLDR